jgi:hypothetical protein
MTHGFLKDLNSCYFKFYNVSFSAKMYKIFYKEEVTAKGDSWVTGVL